MATARILPWFSTCLVSLLVFSSCATNTLTNHRGLASTILTGADQISDPYWQNALRYQKVGLLVHDASRNREGKHVIESIFQTPNVTLKAIFTPEHGLRSQQDQWIEGDQVDPVTGAPVYSLYGKGRSKPSASQLAGIDVMIIDLFDVGVRFYTYGATMALMIQECAKNGIPVWVLDRPNPLGGLRVEGLLLEEKLLGAIAYYHSLPTIHGMTLGELALYYNTERKFHANLKIVPVKNWNRAMDHEDAGLHWIPPSPALESFEQAYLYSVFGALSALNFAIGRGEKNDLAFRVYGAPWISQAEVVPLVAMLNNLKLPGLEIHPVSWVVTRREYQGATARGFRVEILDRKKVNGFESLIRTLVALREFFGARLDFSKIDRQLGSTQLRKAIEATTLNYPRLERQMLADVKSFSTSRKPYLLY